MSAVALGIYVFATTGEVTPLLLVSFFSELRGCWAAASPACWWTAGTGAG